ncbi:NPCBM/NEW2 domain-containing protein [Gimesia panareensis]|uniref:NPCBM/NEW2 domain protein n=1 Tax=Gimesia panareensis TaxID=2527978 RepID=A0A518A8Z7_9PLAN|nr:NPCBM/NEW2 domain-containing protein [Gimesia panareensis]QDT28317.1 NPCBM/NEW2 domain protein [Gimesia panareensis]QDU51189.1 NPCBM/NEW2 domain protein [Gimesia panareensis]
MRLSVALCLILLFGSVSERLQADTLRTASGKNLTGDLIQIEQNLFKLQKKAGIEVIPAAETIRVQLDSVDALPARGGLLILANGDRLHAEILRAAEEALVIRLTACPALDELKVPLETVKAAYFRWPTATPAKARLIRHLEQTVKNSDLFYLKNGDYLEGEFLGFDTKGFQFDSAAGETTVPRDGIAYFYFNPELINFPQPDQLRYQLQLTDGSRVTVSTLTLDPKEFRARTLFGAEIHCERNRLAAVIPLGGRVVPLAQLDPAEYQYTPYLSGQWKWHRNRNVLSGPLISGGQEFDSGLGMHSAAELRYPLAGEYAAFETQVGLDDTVGERAAVEVQIEVDGKPVFQREFVRNERQVFNVPRINLTGAQQLVLKVNFGKNADFEDHLNWCRPVLIKKP